MAEFVWLHVCTKADWAMTLINELMELPRPAQDQLLLLRLFLHQELAICTIPFREASHVWSAALRGRRS
jgi:hypothetical protein